MKRFLNMLRRAARDNRGSGLVMVLVFMICVTLLGATMMQMSYIGLRIKVTERTAAKDFYDAAAAMDEIRAGLQEVVSDCVGASYKNILLNYQDIFNAAAGGASMEDSFHTGFVSSMKAWTYVGDPDDTTDDKLLLSTGATENTGTYDPAVLETFILNRTPPAVKAEVITEPNTEALWEWDMAKDELVLKNVHVSYTDPTTNYSTDVKADIVLTMPSFTYILSEYSVTGLPEFALIAQEYLRHENGNDTVIEGSGYAGHVSLTDTGNLKLSKGTLVCGDEVQVKVTSVTENNIVDKLTVDKDSTLWTRSIVVDGGNAQLLGTAYVADDLDLKSIYSYAELAGRYFGFGSDKSNPSKSSAILINAPETNLDMSELQRLMLAGYSFISDSYTDPVNKTGGSIMGESISTRRNQQAYLIPVSYLNDTITSNPRIITPSDKEYNTSSQPEITGSVNDVLAQNVTLPTGASVKTIRLQILTGQQAIYYFFDFADPQNANAFFADYFSKNTEEIQNYLNSYTTLANSLGIVETAGYTFQQIGERVNENNEKEPVYGLKAAVPKDMLETSAAQMSEIFENQLTKRLFDRDTSTGVNTNPYLHFVKTGDFALLTDNVRYEFQSETGTTEGYVIKGDYTWNGGAASAVRVIIATGDVTVESDFTGLIIAGGDIIIRDESDLKADPEGVTSALAATNNTLNKKLGEFLKDGVVDDYTSEDNTTETSWNFGSKVTYRNWTKNEE